MSVIDVGMVSMFDEDKKTMKTYKWLIKKVGEIVQYIYTIF